MGNKVKDTFQKLLDNVIQSHVRVKCYSKARRVLISECPLTFGCDSRDWPSHGQMNISDPFCYQTL